MPLRIISDPDAAKTESTAGVPADQPLYRYSDFVFLAHQQACANDVNCMRKLNFVVHDYVTDDNTLNIMNAARPGGNRFTPFAPRPGKAFSVTYNDEDEANTAKALIGTPNGNSLTFMLLQHWDKYKGTQVTSSTVFAADDPNGVGPPCLAWELLNVPNW